MVFVPFFQSVFLRLRTIATEAPSRNRSAAEVSGTELVAA
jgi:hypothetical protein